MLASTYRLPARSFSSLAGAAITELSAAYWDLQDLQAETAYYLRQALR